MGATEELGSREGELRQGGGDGSYRGTVQGRRELGEEGAGVTEVLSKGRGGEGPTEKLKQWRREREPQRN